MGKPRHCKTFPQRPKRALWVLLIALLLLIATAYGMRHATWRYFRYIAKTQFDIEVTCSSASWLYKGWQWNRISSDKNPSFSAYCLSLTPRLTLQGIALQIELVAPTITADALGPLLSILVNAKQSLPWPFTSMELEVYGGLISNSSLAWSGSYKTAEGGLFALILAQNSSISLMCHPEGTLIAGYFEKTPLEILQSLISSANKWTAKTAGRADGSFCLRLPRWQKPHLDLNMLCSDTLLELDEMAMSCSSPVFCLRATGNNQQVEISLPHMEIYHKEKRIRGSGLFHIGWQPKENTWHGSGSGLWSLQGHLPATWKLDYLRTKRQFQGRASLDILGEEALFCWEDNIWKCANVRPQHDLLGYSDCLHPFSWQSGALHATGEASYPLFHIQQIEGQNLAWHHPLFDFSITCETLKGNAKGNLQEIRKSDFDIRFSKGANKESEILTNTCSIEGYIQSERGAYPKTDLSGLYRSWTWTLSNQANCLAAKLTATGPLEELPLIKPFCLKGPGTLNAHIEPIREGYKVVGNFDGWPGGLIPFEVPFTIKQEKWQWLTGWFSLPHPLLLLQNHLPGDFLLQIEGQSSAIGTLSPSEINLKIFIDSLNIKEENAGIHSLSPFSLSAKWKKGLGWQWQCPLKQMACHISELTEPLLLEAGTAEYTGRSIQIKEAKGLCGGIAVAGAATCHLHPHNMPRLDLTITDFQGQLAQCRALLPYLEKIFPDTLHGTVMLGKTPCYLTCLLDKDRKIGEGIFHSHFCHGSWQGSMATLQEISANIAWDVASQKIAISEIQADIGLKSDAMELTGAALLQKGKCSLDICVHKEKTDILHLYGFGTENERKWLWEATSPSHICGLPLKSASCRWNGFCLTTCFAHLQGSITALQRPLTALSLFPFFARLQGDIDANITYRDDLDRWYFNVSTLTPLTLYNHIFDKALLQGFTQKNKIIIDKFELDDLYCQADIDTSFHPYTVPFLAVSYNEALLIAAQGKLEGSPFSFYSDNARCTFHGQLANWLKCCQTIANSKAPSPRDGALSADPNRTKKGYKSDKDESLAPLDVKFLRIECLKNKWIATADIGEKEHVFNMEADVNAADLSFSLKNTKNNEKVFGELRKKNRDWHLNSLQGTYMGASCSLKADTGGWKGEVQANAAPLISLLAPSFSSLPFNGLLTLSGLWRFTPKLSFTGSLGIHEVKIYDILLDQVTAIGSIYNDSLHLSNLCAIDRAARVELSNVNLTPTPNGIKWDIDSLTGCNIDLFILRTPTHPQGGTLIPLCLAKCHFQQISGIGKEKITGQGIGYLSFQRSKYLRRAAHLWNTTLLPTSGSVTLQMKGSKSYVTQIEDVMTADKRRFIKLNGDIASWLEFNGETHIHLLVTQVYPLVKMSDHFHLDIQGPINHVITTWKHLKKDKR